MVIEHPVPPFFDWIALAALKWVFAIGVLVVLAAAVGLVMTLVRRGPGRVFPVFWSEVRGGVSDLVHMSWRRVFAIARLMIQESVRKKVVVIAVIFLILLMFAGWFIDPTNNNPGALYLNFVLTTTDYLVLLLVLFLSTLSLPAEFKSKTIFTVVTKPVRASEIILGRILGLAAVVVAVLAWLNISGEKRPWIYFIPAVFVWILFYYSGIHATMSGVVMALLIPMRPRYSKAYYLRKRAFLETKLTETDANPEGQDFPDPIQRIILRQLSRNARESIGLSYRLEHTLAPWVSFVIMPIFALANAGVRITDPSYFNVFSYSPELGGAGMGIFLGLLLGKPIGITLTSFLAVKTKIGQMPAGADWKKLLAVACLGGIGFTMSIFVDTLSFGGQTKEITMMLRDMGKVAVLMGSLCSGILGSVLIILLSRRQKG